MCGNWNEMVVVISHTTAHTDTFSTLEHEVQVYINERWGMIGTETETQ